MLVTSPGDVLALLETPARHHHAGTHDARYSSGPPHNFVACAGPGDDPSTPNAPNSNRSDAPDAALFPQYGPGQSHATAPLQRRILEALEEPLTADALATRLAISPEALRAEITVLEVLGRVLRRGSVFHRAAAK